MPSSEDLILKMGKAKFFSKLNQCIGYWQYPMNKEDIEKTAFVAFYQHYEFLRMTSI